ncbi:MAG TPA: nitroreductase family deazaflavin-dependent oxidoreductase [Acidimicrobiales bacterium]|nr:nitroreductase family deazaflavin-dependent oxidoreductase [Acidimicrobiales bacterium]
MSDTNDFNTKIIEEFRANAGNVGGPFQGAPMILVHHKGARTGTERVSPLVYQAVGDSFAVFGSKGGAPTAPAWYRNVLAHPDIEVEVGTDTVPVRARELRGDERAPIWEKQKKLMPGFAEYEEKTKGIREIPVILLERR